MLMNDQCFNVNAHCVVLGTDIRNNKKYIVSTASEEIIFPNKPLDKTSVLSLNSTLVNFLHDKIKYVSDIELLPQLINLHSKDIDSSDENTLNVIYGFVIDYQPNLQDWHWVEFQDLQPVKYSNIIFEVIQKLY
jgi:hypothetical protein